MARIFLSYARPNAVAAKRAVDALIADGFEVWWDDQLPAHRSFYEVIDERLRLADAVVALWSAHAAKSDWVRAEADFGRTHGRLVQASLDGDLPPIPFNQIQCAKLIDWKGEADHPEWLKLVASVRAVSGRERKETTREPESRRRRFGVSIVAAFAVVATVLGDYWLVPAREHSSPQPVDRFSLQHPPPSERKTPTVAVLPFRNIGNEPTNETLADGVAETLLTMLAQIGELRVIARTSSFSFRDENVDLRRIGEALGADAVLEGSVQRSGERIRISAQLNSSVDGVHLWAENFERPVSDIFAVQDEIARRVAEALKITLAGNAGPGSVGTRSFAAYELTLEAKRLIASRQSANRMKAIPLLERAVRLDPNYGDAWVGLFFAYPDESDAAVAAVQRALEVAPNTSGPHLAQGYLLMRDGDPGAADAMARGLELAPQDTFALASVAAEYRLRSGRYAESAALMRRALMLDPRSANTHLGAALAFEANDDLPGALVQLREMLRLEPKSAQAYYTAGGMLYGSLGRMDEALRFMRRARVMEPDDARIELALGYALIGEHELAAHELESQRPMMNAELFLVTRAQLDLLAERNEAPRELLSRAHDGSRLSRAVGGSRRARSRNSITRRTPRVGTSEHHRSGMVRARGKARELSAVLHRRLERRSRSRRDVARSLGVALAEPPALLGGNRRSERPHSSRARARVQ